MRFRVLGPLEVDDAMGRPLSLNSGKLRALLSVLLVEAGGVVSVDQIVERLWGEDPPATAVATLQSYVAQLRRLLEPHRGPREAASVLVTRAPGYRLVADAESLDLLRFREDVDRGRGLLEAGDAGAAEPVLLAALELWRGEPLSDLPDSPDTEVERARVRQLRVLARELLATSRIALGRPEVAVLELEDLVAQHPLDERLSARLVEGLYAAGRQADALAALRRCAERLRDELGIDPGPDLVALEQAVLRQDPALARRGSARNRPVSLRQPPDAARSPSGGATVPHRPVLPPPRVPSVSASEVTAPPDAAGEAESFVGRSSERDRIRAMLEQVARGNGGVLVLEGEAGIGKTRLADLTAETAAAQGWQVAWSRCADDAGVPALWPWTQLVDHLGVAPLSAPTDEDPDSSRFGLFQQLRDQLRTVSAREPLLLVLDDIQAADDSSLHLLTLLAQHLTGMRLLVVATVRTVGEELPEPVVACLATLAREPRVQRLQLGGLGEDDVRRLLATRLGVEGRDDLARQVHLRTDGNPFFVVELATLLLSEDRLDAPTRPGASAPLPPSVRDVLERRLGRLPGPTVELLRLAAVAGREVELPLLEACVGGGAEHVITLLEPAVAAGVVTENRQTWQWRFSHALVQETLVAGMSRLESARHHAVVAEALLARGTDEADVDRLAHHYFHAVPVVGPAPAVDYARRAAETARLRLAHPEAAEQTRRALELIPRTDPASRHDLLVNLGNDLLRSGKPQQAQEVVAEALQAAKRLGDRERMAEAAAVWGGVTVWNWRSYGVVDEALVALLEELGSEVGDHNATLRARLLGTLGVELAYSPRREEGVAYAAAAVELARGLGDPVLLGLMLNNYGIAAWGTSDRVERRMAAADESLMLVGRGLPARTEFFARLHRGPLRLHLGDLAGFEEDLAGAVRVAAGLSGPEVRPHVLYQEAGRAMVHGQWQEAEVLATEAFDLYRSTSMWGANACWALHQFTFRRQEGRLGDVVDLLVETGDMGIPLIQSVAVLAAAEAGDVSEAHRLRRRWPQVRPQDWTTDAHGVVLGWVALALDEDPRPAYDELLECSGRQIVVGTATACWGPYDTLLGDLALASGQETAATAHLQDAVTQGRSVRSPWQVRAAEAALARLFGHAAT